jgi:ABC-type amino acid transport substrate-binding protein
MFDSTNFHRRSLICIGGVIALGSPLGVFAQVGQPKSQTTLRMAFGDESPPNYWKTGKSSSDVQGVLVELMAGVAKLAGCNFEADAFPLPRVQLMVESGKQDGMVNVVTPQRLEYSVVVAEPLMQGRVGIFVRNDSPLLDRLRSVKTLDELATMDVTIASLQGSGWAKKNLVDRGVKVVYGNGTVAAVKMLIAKRADAVIDMANIIHWILKSEPGGRDVIELPNPVDTVNWSLMISKKSLFANRIDILESAIKRYKATREYSAILGKYQS